MLRLSKSLDAELNDQANIARAVEAAWAALSAIDVPATKARLHAGLPALLAVEGTATQRLEIPDDERQRWLRAGRWLNAKLAR